MKLEDNPALNDKFDYQFKYDNNSRKNTSIAFKGGTHQATSKQW